MVDRHARRQLSQEKSDAAGGASKLYARAAVGSNSKLGVAPMN